MSRTGNLLFPDSEDDGWVTSIIKALPEEKPKGEAPVTDDIEDPVAIEAEAAFAELAAETATRDAISAAGWSAEAEPTAAETPPELGTAEEEWRAATALDALDAMIDRGLEKDDAFSAVDDPIAAEAEAAFAETAADATVRDAIDTAAWTPQSLGPDGELTPAALAALDSVVGHETVEDDPLAPILDQTDADAATPKEDGIFAAGWSAIAHKSDAAGGVEKLTEDELKALDVALAKEAQDPGLFALKDDPVGLEGEAAFAEAAAEVATREAVHDAGWAPDVSPVAITEAVPPEVRDSLAALSDAEQRALDAALAKEAQDPDHFALAEDPVGLAGDAVFAEIAADVSADEAIREASWTADVSPVKVAETVAPDVLDSLSPLSDSEQRALDAAVAEQRISPMDPSQSGDPVAMQADSVFSGIAAELAIADAVLAARTPPPPDPAMVARGGARQPPTGPGLWEVDDLVRAKAEIAFEDAAFDFAYNTVDSLVTGEAAALAAFDQAIASGADPEEALALAIAAAEEIDPGSFGLTQLAATTLAPAPIPERPEVTQAEIAAQDDAGLVASEAAPADDQVRVADDRPEDPVTFARVGDNFDTLPAEVDSALLGGPGDDTLIGDGFEFSLDLDNVAGAGSAFRALERDDTVTVATEINTDILGSSGNDTLSGSANGENIFGYAGDDVLVGGGGADTLSGGDGADQFVFEGGTGADALAHATSLGTDVITDYSATDGDTFGLSDADFGFGDSGTLTGGTDYFEAAAATLSGAPLDASGGTAGPAIVVLGDGSGTDGVDVYYTDDASAMTTDNSYQIADVSGANTGDLDAGDFNLRT